MDVTKTLKPGDRRTARLVRRNGDRLACVRYRSARTLKKNPTTVELIIDERDALGGYHPSSRPGPSPQHKVLVRIDFQESHLRVRIKQANGLWDPHRRGWVLPFTTVQALGLEERIIEEPIRRSGYRTEPDG